MSAVRSAIKDSADGLRRAAERLDALADGYKDWEEAALVDSFFIACQDIMGGIHMSEVYRALLKDKWGIGE